MYPNLLVIPMREDLTKLGISELRTPAEVDKALQNKEGTTLLVINSVCFKNQFVVKCFFNTIKLF